MLGDSKSLMKRGGELVGGEGADTHTAPVAEARGLQQNKHLPCLCAGLLGRTAQFNEPCQPWYHAKNSSA